MYLLIGYFISVIVSGYIVYKSTKEEIITNNGVILLGTILLRLLSAIIPIMNSLVVIAHIMLYVANTEIKFKIGKNK